MSLDKFYTKPEIAAKCYGFIKPYTTDKSVFIEPSAGSGVFLGLFEHKFYAYDLAPEGEGITQVDFFDLEIPEDVNICLGNPPFGTKGSLAVDFLNKLLEHDITTGFILPTTFLKYSVQSKVLPKGRLLKQWELPKDAFEVDGKPYALPTVFQIWSTGYLEEPDLRLRKAPAIQVDGVSIWQHNGTTGSRKVLEEGWTHAWYRQGNKDYTIIFTQDDKEYLRHRMEKSWDQFFFAKADREEFAGLLDRIDIENLAAVGMITPGFGKNDFVERVESMGKLTFIEADRFVRDMYNQNQDNPDALDAFNKAGYGGQTLELIQNSTRHANGDILANGEVHEWKYVESGSGTYYNTTLSYFNKFFTPYAQWLDENGYYDLFEGSAYPFSRDNASPVSLQVSKEIRHNNPAFYERLVEAEKVIRRAYIKELVKALEPHKELVYKELIYKENSGKDAPDKIFIYNKVAKDLSVIGKGELHTPEPIEIVYKNGGLSFKIGNLRLAIGWQNGNGLNNPTIRAFID